MEITSEDFDLAFEETMMHFTRVGNLDDKTLHEVLPRVLGYFEQALVDKYSTEKIIKEIAN